MPHLESPVNRFQAVIIIFPSSNIKLSNLFSLQITTAQNDHEIFFKRCKRSSFQKLMVLGFLNFFPIYPNGTVGLKQNKSVRLEAQSQNLVQWCLLSTFHKTFFYHFLKEASTINVKCINWYRYHEIQFCQTYFLSGRENRCRCYKGHITVTLEMNSFPLS